MKKLILFLAPCVMLGTVVFAAPSKCVDGKIQIAIADVNGKVCWTQAERTAEINFVNVAGTRTAVINDYALDPFEVSVATGLGRFENHSEYLECLASRQRLTEKIADMKPSERLRNQRTIDYLESENSKR